MYTGTLIDDLMAAVERAEAQAQTPAQEEGLQYRLIPTLYEATRQESALLGAA